MVNYIKRFFLLASLIVSIVGIFLFVSPLSLAQHTSSASPPEYQNTPTVNYETPLSASEPFQGIATQTETALPPTSEHLETDEVLLTPTPQPDISEKSIFKSTPTPTLPTPSPWTGGSRINILLLGLDYGDWDSPDRDGPPRSDTMILVSIDTESKEGGILSIPRDLWVDIPGMIRPNKINAAYRFGEHYNLPGGGPGLAMKTVEQLLGVPINYYVEIDFYAFEKIIDEIGGVEVVVEEKIKVHRLAPQGSVILEPGTHHLDGATALAYARNRSTGGGDFDRSQRQQQIMISVQNSVLELDNLPKLILKAPTIYKEVSSGVRTNLTLNKVIQLGWLSQSIPPENIHQAAIGPGDIMYDRAEDGQSILLPIPFRIQQKVDQTLAKPTSNLDLTMRMQAEEARLYIINASGDEKLGDLTARYLSSNGATVIGTEIGENSISQTSISDYSGKIYTMQYLARLMAVPFSEIKTEFEPERDEDIIIILGSDWKYKSNVIR
jgi:polyisoprenyl-teichoic acid--peptidoglycan teichoic acid transferase